MPHQQRYRRMWFLCVAFIDVTYGGTYLLGGTAESAALRMMKQILPMPIWGAALVGVAVLLLFSRHIPAGVAGGAVWLMFSLTALTTVLRGTALGAGGPWLYLGVALLHLLITYGAVAGLSTVSKG